MSIPVNSIEIPRRFVWVARDWYDSMNDMLYAISSSGGLTLGTIRPPGCDSDEEWYYSLWCELSVDLAHARLHAERGYNFCKGYDDGDGKGHDSDYPILCEFEDWVNKQCELLAEAYGLEG